MPESIVAGIPVVFPFEPYEVQRAYMEKVIMCLRDGTNGVLESPTGTGKTLSLLCSSLAWLLHQKQEIQAQIAKSTLNGIAPRSASDKQDKIEVKGRFREKDANWGAPKIIYASRTHSQLTQAMQELKRTAYSSMRAVVLGSRDQLCIHPEVMREQGNANKVQMCKAKVDTRTCSFHSRVESRKDDPSFRGPTIMDIEDLVKVGQKLKMCPYYAVKELVADADITFMPYNYLLDPIARKANKVELHNTIIILDEAHNIEKICEECASVQIKSSDVAMAIDDTTHIMAAIKASGSDGQDCEDESKDFTLDDLTLLKEMLLELEKAIDEIEVENKIEGVTLPASYIYDLLGKANLNYKTSKHVIVLLEKLVQFLAVQSQTSRLRKGKSYQTLADMLNIVFINKEDQIEKIYKSFKVHIQLEEIKQSQRHDSNKDVWLSKNSNANSEKKAAKIINYWCFNPGFGMEQLLNKNIRSIILTSGTLAPLKPLIAELALPVMQQLENPHIVSQSQVYVKIIGSGPDREPLMSNFQNRDNPKYVSSLGSTILNVARIVPDGLLVFFPSYPLLNQCVNSWQASGLWADLSRFKPIFVEPKGKDDFLNTMEGFYESIKSSKGACFMAVCRGKVSEGLDFADRNGRAVIITGLPFPPFKDPKVILKKKYLDDNRTKENQLLSGQAWYALEATRAVNQAIGRVIRHRHDYGAILLCDVRFQQSTQVQQLSKWIREILGNQPKSSLFGPIVKELRDFFKNAEKTMPKASERIVESLVSEGCEFVNARDIVSSKYFPNSQNNVPGRRRFQTALNNAIQAEETNMIEGWSLNDYAKATARPSDNKLPSVADFMSRLDGDVSTIDFNSKDVGTPSNSQIQINKRRRSPTNSPSTSSTARNDTDGKRKYRLVDNTRLTSSLPSKSSGTPTISLDQFKFIDKPRLENDQNKKAPEERVEFLRVLRSSLSSDDFKAFSAALISYKTDNTIGDLMDVLFQMLGKPCLFYMLQEHMHITPCLLRLLIIDVSGYTQK
ncbi:regulator of telomere elongation helicase 1 homolog isoform X2 [Glossina fuscipes]|uniref:Regulator of telomere elongation helicase 1 homolog n=1 Tax=Glossina fuscipes TaxID=7396 RepID=A0A9C5ZF72_9MUSC|nr:regulator of telomere elongation helicase 1 homolog isoform X2 [Glossina fuscipes]